VVSFTPLPLYPPRIEDPVPIEQEAGRTAVSVRTIWRSENSLPYRDSNSEPSLVQLVYVKGIDVRFLFYIPLCAYVCMCVCVCLSLFVCLFVCLFFRHPLSVPSLSVTFRLVVEDVLAEF
jgi:hypothetical protein